MALSGPLLATQIQTAIGQSSQPLSAQNLGMANDIVAHLQTGIVAFAPGTIVGTVPPSGGPLAAGAGSNGLITLVPSALESAFFGTFGHNTSQIKALADAISNHVITMGKVVFAAGTITGVCTNTAGPPPTPGVFTGVGAGGTITGLSGSTLATAIVSALGQTTTSTQVQQMATAIVTHIMTNALVALPVATGVCTPGGGPLSAGTAAGGIIS